MPLSPHLNVQVIDAINRAITAGLRAEPGRGLEIGGILLGSVEQVPGSPTIVRIERFEPVESEHRHGSSYGLSDRDRRVLGRKLAWWHKHAHKENLRPVGFFRSHTRRGLYLDNDDYMTVQNYFPEQQSVFLLVRPVAGAAGVAGFFFWQDGDIRRESSFQEFPFDAAKLPLVTSKPVVQTVPVAVPEPEADPVVAPVMAVPPGALPAAPAASVVAPLNATAAVMPPRVKAARVPPAPVSPKPIPGRRKPLPAWVRLAAPVAVGVVLGAIVFKVTTAGIFRPAAVNQAKSYTKPAPIGTVPAETAAAPTPSNSPAVQKPSPLQPRSRPTLEPAPAAVKAEKKPARREVIAQAPAPAPTGSASRAEAGPTASVAVSRPPEPPPDAPVLTPAPASVALAPITAPVRSEQPPPRPAAVATVTVEPVSGSKIGRIVRHFPGFRKHNQDFVPARPIRQITPSVPADEHLSRDVPVDLKVTVDPAGYVADVEHTRGADMALVRLAENAARNWQFVPARRNDETVSSEVILHFMFRSPKAEP